MALEDDLAAQLRDAMRMGDNVRRDTIRQLRGTLHNEAINRGHALTDDETIGVIRRLVNQHRDSIDEFTRASRSDLVGKEQAELDILLTYLPAQMSREEIATAARQSIGRVGASGRQDQGKVMRDLAEALRGKADMRTVNEVVQELLT